MTRFTIKEAKKFVATCQARNDKAMGDSVFTDPYKVDPSKHIALACSILAGKGKISKRARRLAKAHRYLMSYEALNKGWV